VVVGCCLYKYGEFPLVSFKNLKTVSLFDFAAYTFGGLLAVPAV
jgi:hypothetical protein